jgi:hypothetical protein
VDALVLLVGSVLSQLRALVGVDVCPGDWAWSVTIFGLMVGLLPACGAVAVAVWRRRSGPDGPRGAAWAIPLIAVFTCGLLPLLAFNAVGQVFSRVGTAATVLSRSDQSTLAGQTCFGLSERRYLGTLSVSDVLGGGVIRTAVFAVPLVFFPLCAALFVWLQGRIALRRGPRWPSRYFWLSVLVVAVLTGPMPAGTTAQLWIGVVGGAFLGVIVVLMVPPPPRTAGTRAGASGPSLPSRPVPSQPAGAASADRAVSSAQPARKRGFQASGFPALVAAQWAALHGRAGSRLAGAPEQVRSRLAEAPEQVRSRLAGAPERMRARLAELPNPTPPPLRAGLPLAATPGPLPSAINPNQHLPNGPAVPTPRLPPTLVAPAGGLNGRFELVRRLGEGGFGGVWLAVDHALGQRVAVKAAHVPDHETELRIRREAHALGAVRHPHCVRILDLVDSRHEPGLAPLHGLVIVMEYVEGRSLGELVAGRGPIDDVRAARLWLPMADALAAAHRQGVLHRDVKPGNVLLDVWGEPRLIDFGIARTSGDATLTLHGMVVGTPDFLAPEVARGERSSPASDGWQLAATISFALTGWPPRGYHPEAIDGLRAAAASAALTYLPSNSAHRRLLESCLAADPANRPDLITVRDTLDNWLANHAPAGPPSSPLIRAFGRMDTAIDNRGRQSAT